MKDFVKKSSKFSFRLSHLDETISFLNQISKILSEGFPHVRVDFYEIDGKVYFGEMTFFDDGGFMKAKPISWEKEWGDLIELPERRCKH